MNNYTANFKNGNLYIAYTQMGLLPINVEIDPCDGLEPLRYAPERTCRVELIDTGNEAAYEHYEYVACCRLCHHEFGYVLYSEDGSMTWQNELPNYCPNCGAKVIE